MSISEQLRDAINESGETIYHIAKEADLSYGVVFRFSRGQRDLRLESFDKLAKVFDMHLTKPKRLPKR